MPIINKGIFDTSDAFLRQTGNDWPTAQVLYTSDVVEATANLYFTNTRAIQALTIGTVQGSIAVTGNLVANGLIIRNISVSDSVLSGATSANTVLADSVTSNIWNRLYTANVVETSSNLYFTTSRARSSFAAGQGIAISANGVISSKGDDTGLGAFNSGINLANALLVSNNFANLVTFDAGDGTNFIVYSLHLTNYSNQTAFVTGRYVSGANTILFANLMEMPGPSFVEMQVKPQTYKAGDQLQLQSFSSPTQPANGLVTALVSYQGSADVNFDRTANILTDNNVANIFTTVNRTSIIESIKVANPNPADIPVSVWFADPSYNLFAYIAANVTVPAFSSIELCDYPKAMRDNFTLRAQKSGTASNPISLFLSTKYTTQYIVTPSTETVNEGGTVTFNIDTLNVGDGTTLYYTLSFYSNSLAANDFVSNISGSLIVTNDTGSIDITSNADNGSFTEGDETFRLQLRKNSISGTVLAESANVVIKNTSNIVVFGANITTALANAVVGTGNLTIQINTTNLGNNQVLYYQTTGNVISSDFLQGNTGTITVTDNAANLILTSNSAVQRTFTLNVRTNSQTGTVLYTTPSLQLVPTQDAYIVATGGNVTYTANGYRVHVFTSSGNITIASIPTITSLGTSNLEVIVIGGGGAGGPAGTPGSYGGGGGGAGGYYYLSNVIAVTGNSVVVIGAGGTGSLYNGSSTSGSNSTIKIGATTFQAMGGGRGGVGQPAGTGDPGGSGGGTGLLNTGFIAGSGFGSQGYPGGLGHDAPTIGFNVFGAGGGGGAGAKGANAYYYGDTVLYGAGGDGVPIKWIPSSFGTSGPQPGRYFAGGGGAGMGQSNNGGVQGRPGGAGGGGKGEGNSGPGGFAGNVNTGGGGGGSGPYYGGGGGTSMGGGSGIVIIRYPYN